MSQYENIKALEARPEVESAEYWTQGLNTESGRGYEVILADGYNYGGSVVIIERTYREVLKTLRLVERDKPARK